MHLMVFYKKICKEFILSFHGADEQEVVLKKHVFGLMNNAVIRVERHNGQFSALCTEDAAFMESGTPRMSVLLRFDDPLQLMTRSGEKIYLFFSEKEPSFTIPEKYHIKTNQRISIGSGTGNQIVYTYGSLVSGVHAELFYNNGWNIADHGKLGVCVNDVPVKGVQRLHFGDSICLCGLHIQYFGQVIAVHHVFGVCRVSHELSPYDVQRNRLAQRVDAGELRYFNRPARKLPAIDSGEVQIDAPPAVQEAKKKSILSAIARPLTMALPMLLGFTMMTIGMAGRGSFMSIGIITAVSSAVFGAGWAMVSLRQSTEEETEKDRTRFNAYGNYLISISRDLAGRYRSNYLALNAMYPSAEKCVNFDESSPMLWSRNASHDDFLFVRLGKGTMPFQITVKVPNQGFALRSDALVEGPQTIAREYAELKDIPVGVDLQKQNLVGILSAKGEMGAVRAVQLILAQIAANVCYTDVKIVLLNKKNQPEDQHIWGCLRSLPHCWSADRKKRYFSMSRSSVEDISYELLRVLRVRDAAENKESPKPYYIVIVTDPALLEQNLLANYLLKPKPEYGTTTLIMANSRTELPNSCRFVIESDAVNFYVNDLMDPNQARLEIRSDEIHSTWLAQMAHRFANIRVEDKLSEDQLPASIDFLTMYGVRSVEALRVAERWRSGNVCDNMSVPIGVKADGSLCNLDIHEKIHGPHGLVAGTTGSGKSELLQSYILSLCVNFSPDDVNFLIIDYKGGGMANLFADLPHLAGQITNLSGNSIRRAMISIKSESIRRQRLFNDYLVNNINQYTQLYKDGRAPVAIPHLLIVVDEFAELKNAEPEFMFELISIAQVGRSLGIHLILATQKPSGTVNDNIRSNSKFRICLRVQDKQDSMDMLHHPDAAFITQPGGAIFQVGSDEIYEPFQSAWSGAVYNEDLDPMDRYAMPINDTGTPTTTVNRIQLQRAEEKKLEWYSTVVGIMRRTAPDVALIPQATGQAAAAFLEKVYSLLPRGVDFRGNAESLSGFLKFWPENASELSDAETARLIMQQAMQSGAKLPSPDEKTQLDALIEYVAETAKANHYKESHKLWLDVLPERVVLDGLEGWKNQAYEGSWRSVQEGWYCGTLAGLIDDPENQTRTPLYVDFASGHHAVVGSVASGKSTFMQTVLYGLVNSYSPAELNLYIVDYSSRMLGIFNGLPHVGGVVFENEPGKLEKLFHLLSELLAQRKEQMVGGTFAEYKKQRSGDLPAVVFVIDNYGSFKDKTEGKYENLIMQLSREGIAYGIYLFISGGGFGMADISARIGENMKTVITLELADKYKYVDALHTTNITILPEAGIRGRGLVRSGDRCLEFQTALINDGGDDYTRGKNAEQLFARMRADWRGPSAEPIPEIPANPIFSDFIASPSAVKKLRTGRILPIGYAAASAEVAGVDLSRSYCTLVTEQTAGSGRQTMTALVRSALEMERSQVVIVTKDDAYDRLADDRHTPLFVRSEDELFDYFKSLTPEFVRRNKQKYAFMEDGADGDELFEKMKSTFSPVFIMIDDLAAFFASVYQKEGAERKMNGFLENILAKGALHHIYFFGRLCTADASRISAHPAFKSFVSAKKGILTDGAPAMQKLLDFGNLGYAEAGKPLRGGNVCMTVEKDGQPTFEQLVIPNTKR